MTNYSKTTDFEAKDALPSGDANKVVKGTEFEAEFDDIVTAIASKADIASPTFTGVVVVPSPMTLGGTSMTATAAELNILDGVTSTTAELNILDGVTSTAAELNILDGVTSTAAELNILDGVTSTAAELNILDRVTSTAAELNILDGVTSTAAEINTLDGLDRGSILYGNASSATAVLGQGTANQVLTSDGTDIAWQDGAQSPVSGFMTTTALPSTAVAVTGVGFQPSLINFQMTTGSSWEASSFGYYDGTVSKCVYRRNDGTTPFSGALSYIWFGANNAITLEASAVGTSMDADGFTFTTSSLTDTAANVIWTAYP